jgi:transcriptional regulator with XRE-family HTH domain
MRAASAEALRLAVAANVRAERARLGLTQEDLAEQADLALRYVQQVEAGRANLTLAVLASFATAFSVPAPNLLRPGATNAAKRGRPAGLTEKRPRRRR